jgi:hypothetical protein
LPTGDDGAGDRPNHLERRGGGDRAMAQASPLIARIDRLYDNRGAQGLVTASCREKGAAGFTAGCRPGRRLLPAAHALLRHSGGGGTSFVRSTGRRLADKAYKALYE